MGIQEFVLISGSAPAAGTAASVAHEALRAAAAMKQESESELRAELGQLRQEHRDLDVAIEALHNSPGSDLLQVQRLKKRKLHLRDRIIQIEDQLTPDIIARSEERRVGKECRSRRSPKDEQKKTEKT